jgi:hypothetical protein
MALSFIGWLSGLTASGVFLFSIIFGLFAIIKAMRRKSKPLFYLGLTYFFAGLIFTGDVLDFLTILSTQTNIDNSTGMLGLINWMWFPGVAIFGMFFGAEIIVPKRKWIIFIIYLILGIIFDALLFLDPSSAFTYTDPAPGVDLINDNLIFESLPSMLALVFLVSILVLDGFGFLIKSIQATGDIRRRLFYLSLGAFFYIVGGILDGLFDPGIILIFIRSLMVISPILFYLGVKA